MIINHNMSALFANRLLNLHLRNYSKSIERLSSGERINYAGDDASGLAVSEKMRSQIRGLRQAEMNAQTGIAFLQTAEGSLQEVHQILQRIRELSVQAANGIYTQEDRSMIQIEVSQLLSEINRISTTAEFNRFKILDGSLQQIRLHVGANQNQAITINMGTMNVQSLGLTNVSMSTADTANTSIGLVDNAINRVSTLRASLGAAQSRLNYTVENIEKVSEAFNYADSIIRDTDMSREVIELTKNQILAQTSTAALVQANLIPNIVLQLLG